MYIKKPDLSLIRLLIVIQLLIFLPVKLAAKFYNEQYQIKIHQIEKKYRFKKARFFSGHLKGIKTRIKTHERLIALTFDACGGKYGNGIDRDLINFLIRNNIKATFFLSGKWIKTNKSYFLFLSKQPMFDIENHGLNHRPACTKTCSKYRIRGTGNIKELVQEIEINADKIHRITGRRPIFFRSGTATYDNVALQVIYDLGYIPIGYTGYPCDGDNRISQHRILYNINSSSKNGAILLMHMNHPRKNLTHALKIAFDRLKEKKYRFVKLSEFTKYIY